MTTTGPISPTGRTALVALQDHEERLGLPWPFIHPAALRRLIGQGLVEDHCKFTNCSLVRLTAAGREAARAIKAGTL